MKQWRNGLVALAGALALAAASASAEVTVGFQTSLSGPIASIGVPQAKGAATAFATMSEVGGQKIKFIQLDDASDPSTAVRNARKLVDEYHVDIMIGGAGVPLVAAMARVCQEQKVPLVALAPIAVPPDLAAWVIVATQPLDLMIAADVEHMKKVGIKTVGYLGFSDSLGDLVYKALVKAAGPLGIKVVANERFARGDSSVTAQVLKIIAAKPDAVLTGVAGTPGALPNIALGERGYRGPIYSTHGIISPDFIRVGGAAVEGVLAPAGPIIVAEQLPETNPIRKVALDYRAAYLKVNGKAATDSFSSASYDGWLVFMDAAKRALRKAKPGTPEFRAALRDALMTTKEVVGTQGVYNFTPNHAYGVDSRARVMVTLKHGKWKLLP
jgi:branched-chain amino acid transport system substrate-binding protein